MQFKKKQKKTLKNYSKLAVFFKKSELKTTVLFITCKKNSFKNCWLTNRNLSGEKKLPRAQIVRHFIRKSEQKATLRVERKYFKMVFFPIDSVQLSSPLFVLGINLFFRLSKKKRIFLLGVVFLQKNFDNLNSHVE